MAAEAWPSILWIAFTLAPALTASEAAVCRSSCGNAVHYAVYMAAKRFRDSDHRMFHRDRHNMCAWFTCRGLVVDQEELFGDIMAAAMSRW
jgi:hypothetical protein